jgi:hypothetical protein
VIITILRFIIVSITWFISTLPFLIPYHILLTSQSKKIGYKLSIEHILIVYIFVYYVTGVLSFTGIFIHNSFETITQKGLIIPPLYYSLHGLPIETALPITYIHILP